MTGRLIYLHGEPVPQSECTHGVTFDEKASHWMAPEEVRRRFPRFSGTCKRCGWSGIYYASTAHYVAGNW